MSLTAGSKIKQADIASNFSTNVVDAIFAGAYHNANVPLFGGKVYRNTSYYAADSVLAFSAPEAIPQQDLDAPVAPAANTGLTGEKITGATVYTALTNVVANLSRVRNFNSYWYHQNNGSFSLVETKSGKAVFKPHFDALPAYSAVNSTAVAGRTRSVNVPLQAINVDDSTVKAGKIASAANIITFFNNLKTAWSTASANAITYQLYTCHRNCHNNCHGSRGRR